MTADALLEVRGLRCQFDTPDGVVRAVDGVDIEIRRGETVALVGESGSGKSVTALAILRLLEAPGRVVGGEVRFAGRDLLQLGEREMDALRGDRITMIFQEPMTALDPVARIGNQIAESLRTHKGLSRNAARARAAELLARVGIPDPGRAVRAYAHELSGGMRQRVMIAAAIACGPELIIADEPTTALDVTIQAQILELLDALRRETGAGLLLITHDLGVVAEVADRAIVMYAGQVMESGTVERLFHDPSHPYTAGLLACVPDIETSARLGGELPSIPGTIPSPLDLPAGCRFRDRCPRAFVRCVDEPPMLPVAPDQAARCWLNAP